MKKTFSKIAVVALALSFATTTSALTAADIQLLVSMGVIPADKAAAATAALGGSSTTTTSCGTYARDLTLGSTGADVVSLQSFLEAKGFLTIPTGTSKGYFGQLTVSALAKYQAANAIAPAAGYFGPMTRAKVSGDCSTTGTGTSTGSTTGLGGGEASLENFDFTSGDDSDVEEGMSGDIAEIEFDVEDGDIMLDRVDLAFVDASSSATDLWDVLESVELVIDGDVVGEADLSDEDEYLDEDDGTVRISGIDTKIEEGETANIVVRVTVQDNVDSEDLIDVTVNVLDDGIRGTDSEGIQQYVGVDTEEVDFSIEEAGTDEELNVSTSTEDPDATTLKVEDNAKSDSFAIFAFDLEAEENDIEIDTIDLEIVTDSTTSDVISDLVLEIDGEEFDDWSYVAGGTSTRTVTFDINGDFTVEADSEVVVVLMAEFKAANGTNYDAGETVSVSIDNGDIEGEGADDISSDGTASGEEHTLSVEGIIVPASGVTTTTDTQGDNDTVGIYTIEFEVTAFEEDFFIKDTASSTDRTVSTGGVEYVSVGTGTTSATLSSTAEDTAGVFKIEEGQTETFTLTVTFDPTTAGQYRLTLEEVWASSNSDGVTGSVVTTVEATDFRTAYENIN